MFIRGGASTFSIEREGQSVLTWEFLCYFVGYLALLNSRFFRGDVKSREEVWELVSLILLFWLRSLYCFVIIPLVLSFWLVFLVSGFLAQKNKNRRINTIDLVKGFPLYIVGALVDWLNLTYSICVGSFF